MQRKIISQDTNLVTQKLQQDATSLNGVEVPPIDPHFRPVITFCPWRDKEEGGQQGYWTLSPSSLSLLSGAIGTVANCVQNTSLNDI